jgi:hypothetical protein
VFAVCFTPAGDREVWGVCFSPDGRALASSGRAVQVWDAGRPGG